MKLYYTVADEYVWSIKNVAKMCIPLREFMCSKNECTFILYKNA
jgi:hypothetical protein